MAQTWLVTLERLSFGWSSLNGLNTAFPWIVWDITSHSQKRQPGFPLTDLLRRSVRRLGPIHQLLIIIIIIIFIIITTTTINIVLIRYLQIIG